MTQPPAESPDAAFARIEEPTDGRQPPPQDPSRGFPILAYEWAREHLFSNVTNSILTLLCLWLLWETIPPLISWAFIDAVWTADDSNACREAAGACWVIIANKYRFILFGFYPFEEQGRPLIAMIAFVVVLILSCFSANWRPWLGALWAVVIIFTGMLMWGGILGMVFVENASWGGLPLTLILSVVGIGLAFPLSVLLALGRRSNLPAIRSVCVGFIELIRGVPLISVLFMASVMFPLFLPEGMTIDKLMRAQVGIILFTAAYLAEAVRGGLQAIPRGQYEAADALGLSYWKKTGLIILPQTLKHSIPPIVNQFISMFKDTSLVIIIGLFDLLATTKATLTDPEWRLYYIEGYLFAAVIFWAFCFFMSRFSQYLERRLETGHKR